MDISAIIDLLSAESSCDARLSSSLELSAHNSQAALDSYESCVSSALDSAASHLTDSLFSMPPYAGFSGSFADVSYSSCLSHTSGQPILSVFPENIVKNTGMLSLPHNIQCLFSALRAYDLAQNPHVATLGPIAALTSMKAPAFTTASVTDTASDPITTSSYITASTSLSTSAPAPGLCAIPDSCSVQSLCAGTDTCHITASSSIAASPPITASASVAIFTSVPASTLSANSTQNLTWRPETVDPRNLSGTGFLAIVITVLAVVVGVRLYFRAWPFANPDAEHRDVIHI
jgi:hypothetical protein